jgi:hypothetical protein
MEIQNRPTQKHPAVCVSESTPFIDVQGEPAVRGFLHSPSRPNGNAIVLTHGAGANCQSKLLVEMSNALAAADFTVLRCDLPFRQARPHGPPFRGSAVRDRDGLRRAIAAMRERGQRRVYVGGHSYGGRQASMLIAEEPQIAEGLLLLSYPLHPPRKAGELRTGHFAKLATPTFFVHGTHDPFGTIEEIKSALELILGPHKLREVDGAGHGLLGKKVETELLARIVDEFRDFVGDC